jgi:peptidoglycan lytic transglycosylase
MQSKAQSKAIVICTFAAAILATTANIASARAHYLHGHAAYRTAYHHRIVHRAAAWQAEEAHERYGQHAVRTVRASASYGDAYSGIASVYSGGHTANGEYASAGGLTAAHRTLPFGTMVRVTNKGTGRSIVVRINDRGPFVRGRVIDLTPAGARALGFSGLAPVTLSVEGRS